jgi:hypothetical protein
MQMNNIKPLICNWCNQPSTIIWVHGHGQCSVCGTNIEECCRGEEAHPQVQFSEDEKKDKSVND